jgi:hypothetical protein
VTNEQEYQDSRLFTVFYATTHRLPQEVIEWSQSPEGKTALEDWEADYRAALARWRRRMRKRKQSTRREPTSNSD